MDPKKVHESRHKLGVASRERKRAYIDPSTGLFDEKYTHARNCPVCDSARETELFFVRGGRYVKCCECGLVYLNPVFTDEALELFYRGNHVVQSQVVEEDSVFYTKLYEKGLRQVMDQRDGVGNLLDVGCSSGCFLAIAKRHGWNAVGIELNNLEAGLAKKKGFDVYSDIQSYKQKGKQVDVITLWDVFEHIKDGKTFLLESRRLLTEKGVVFLQIPISDSLAARIMQEHCNMFDGMEHVNIYGKKALTRLAEVCGMEMVSYTTVISEFHVLNNYINYEAPYSGSFSVKDKLFGVLNEADILTAELGYKAQVVIQMAQ